MKANHPIDAGDAGDARDARGYFMLPQDAGELAYYVYGTPGQGRAQYCHPDLLSFLLSVAAQWGARDSRKIGIGNISLAGGARFRPHLGHRSGLEVDLRPLRRDGLHLPVSYRSACYDAGATAALVQLLRVIGAPRKILFNDTRIEGVCACRSHDDHLHVELG